MAEKAEKAARVPASEELRKARRALTRARGGIKKSQALYPKLSADERVQITEAMAEIAKVASAAAKDLKAAK